MIQNKHYKFSYQLGPGGARSPCCARGTVASTKRQLVRKFRRAAKKDISVR